ncbi:aspartyl-phosphate phosphatase Spo0E family protein [Cohnella zeiphila]|uniref:Aspartyl-phosphate phosphatase Spo0E family protein n=1 Tax=Cohnella zeiphila TaxID=2761120 RepID=A0A7X0SPT6_9BACL|nr:aspartyl-phosphate phosphatase Spo0E family protein [Cohnella zeiphila]MBB6733940.1 aspartyl-phosphate phosphatase Spo0E family protein [Cohnella zeiphila]
MDKNLLIHRLQLLQNRLYEMANNRGNLTDPDILAVSEEADRLILQLQKERMNERKARSSRGRKPEDPLFADPKTPEKVGQESGALILKHP